MRRTILILLTLIPFFVLGQKRGNVWCFGHHAAVNFNTSIPTPDSSSVISRGSCASICDTSGSLLFYSSNDTVAVTTGPINGAKIYSKNHQLMQNGDSINSQGWYYEIAIVPFPEHDGLYYVFTIGVTSFFGIYYSLVDMNANGGLGAVLQKNVQLKNFKQICVTAIKHGNGRDWWILFRRWDSSNNKFYKYLVTPTGISNISVQNIGSLINSGFGNIEFNSEGNKMMYINIQGLMEYYDFDRCTGTISNPQTIFPEQIGSFSRYFEDGQFSPSGNLFYTTLVAIPGYTDSCYLIQYNLNSANIALSADTLLKSTIVSNMGQLKLAPDNKIYLSTVYNNFVTTSYPYPDTVHSIYNDYLSVINSPDSLGIACDFQPWSFYLGGKRSYYGLPNNPDYDLGPTTGSACDTLRPIVTFTATDTSFCSNQCISFNDSSTKIPTKWQWFFSGAVPDSSTLQNPANICYSSPGSYDVKLIACNEVGCDTLLLSNYISVYPLPVIELGNDTSTCNLPVLLDGGSGNTSYQWSNGATTQTIIADSSSLYTVTVINANGCINSDSVSVTINSLPVIALGEDTSTCNIPVLLDAGSGNISYLWSNGASTQTISVSSTSLYTVIITDTNNCSNSDSVLVTINPLPVISFNAFTQDTLCTTHGIQTINNGNPPGGSYTGTGVTGNLFDPNVAGIGWHYITYQFTDSLGCVNSVTDSVWVDLCSGIASISNNDEIKIFPNPASNSITIIAHHLKGTTYTLTVTDIMGRIIYKDQSGQHPLGSGVRGGYFTKDLDCSGFAKGMYIVTITTNKEQLTQKFIRQ